MNHKKMREREREREGTVYFSSKKQRRDRWQGKWDNDLVVCCLFTFPLTCKLGSLFSLEFSTVYPPS